MQKEIWKEIKGYESCYLISNLGNVFSIQKNKKMSFGDNGRGYKFIYLWINKDKKRFYVHRLVAINFLKNPNNYNQVNHKNCDKSNNAVYNLEWCSEEQNIKHAVKNKRFYSSEYQKQQTSLATRGSNSKFSKLTEKQVFEIKKLIKDNELTQNQIADMFNVTRSNICAIKRNKSWKHI